MLKKIASFLFVFAVIVGAIGVHPVHAATTVSLSSLMPGDLVRGQTFSAVYYYGKDGFRYVFPNDKTYFTWYTNFDSVKWLSDADLGKIQIGGNVTYKPGVKMIKINTDPKTYAVDANGTLRWVKTESAAVSLYGSSWNTMIDDVPDGFFSNYTTSDDDISAGTDFSMTAVQSAAISIDVDKDLTAFTEIDISATGYSDEEVTIEPGDVVRFVNNDTTKHTATGDDLTWGSGTISANGGFWQKRFSEEGTYTYFCSYHPDMTGAIIVQ